MDTPLTAVIGRLLDRAGLKPTQHEIDDLASFLEGYQERLQQLHAIDVENEEVAGVFSPRWDADA
jgi:hypothetical protein